MLERRGPGPLIEVALESGQTSARRLQALVAYLFVTDTGCKEPGSSFDKPVPPPNGAKLP